MAVNLKISNRVGYEDIYGEVSTVKVTDIYDVERSFVDTSDANITASDVSLGKTAYDKNGNLVQGTAESSGEGVSINGIIDTYIVEAGENINAGDFISFVNRMLSYENSSNSAPSAILLEPNKVFIAHAYSNSNYLYSTIVTIDGTTMTPTTTPLSTVQYSCYYAPSAVLLEPNKVFIAHTYSSSKYLYSTIVTIDGTTMTPITTQLSTVSRSSNYAPSAILLEPNKVFIAHTYSSTKYLAGTIAEINGVSVTATQPQIDKMAKLDKVKPKGIAVQAGIAGQTINCCTPN